MHPKNKTGRKSLDRLCADPRVQEIWTEDDGFNEKGGVSYWLLLSDDYHWDDCSCLHECTIKDLYSAMSEVQKR